MKRMIPALGLLALLGLAGCASSNGIPTAGDLLAGARGSLVQDDLDTARVWLGSARDSLGTDEERKQFQLLDAEVDIRSGEPALAADSMDGLLEQYPDDPRVHEMAGKARLQLGLFGEASGHFSLAANRYSDEDDVSRATDLLALSRGLEAYAEGHVATAQEHWAVIRDRGLRTSVLQASGATEPRAADTVLVNTYDPTP